MSRLQKQELLRKVLAERISRPRTEPASLRAHPRQSLPEYRVPGAFVALDRLPPQWEAGTGRRCWRWLLTRPVLADFAQEIVDIQFARVDPEEMERLIALMRESGAG